MKNLSNRWGISEFRLFWNVGVLVLALQFLGAIKPVTAEEITVYRINAGSVRGEFVSSSPEKIVVKSRNSEVEISVADFRNLSVDEAPPEIDKARRNFDNNRFDEGLAELSGLTGVTGIAAEEAAYLKAFGSAMSASTGGAMSPKDAGSATYEFTRNYPDSIHTYEIVEILGRQLVDIGSDDLARAEFEKLASANVPTIRGRGKLLLGQSQLRLGDATGAQKSFQELIESPETSQEFLRLKSLAEPMLAKALVENGNVEKAREMVNAVISRENTENLENAELFANCYNVLGLCHLKKGEMESALLDFLKTDLLFNSNPESHAEALFYLTTIGPQVQQNDLAFESREKLNQRYRNSLWAKKLNQ
ncbi:MAG: tetratricopeptide repeat protein [Pirellulaceae bacterium]